MQSEKLMYYQADDISTAYAAKVADLSEKVVTDEIIREARESGVTDLYLMDRDFVLSALREKQERMNPKPLTLEEMREMNGEPVWTETIGLDRTGRWELITCETVCACPLEQKLRAVTWAGDVEWYPLETYGKTWIAYRHKPQEVQP